MSEAALAKYANGHWNKTYYQAEFMSALFRDAVFKRWYPKAVQMIFDQAGAGNLPDAVGDMMHTVMFFQMNSELPSLVDSMTADRKGIDETKPTEYDHYVATAQPMLAFCNKADMKYLNKHPHKAINVTAKNWKTDVIPRYKVTQRGYTYVVAGIDQQKYNTVVWADDKYYANMKEPQQQAAAPPHA